MAVKQSKDKFANKFFGTVVESAANTLTFAEIKTNVSVFDKQAWILHRLEWYFTSTMLALLLGANDSITLALTNSDKLNTVDLSSAGVIDMAEFQHHNLSSVGFQDELFPVTRDFGSLPSGGLIIAPRPLYIAVKGTSLATAATVAVRGYFTSLELSADEYLELVDFYRIVQ